MYGLLTTYADDKSSVIYYSTPGEARVYGSEAIKLPEVKRVEVIKIVSERHKQLNTTISDWTYNE